MSAACRTVAEGLVSVVIPTYNRAGLLRRAVESIRRQTVAQDCEIIVVDDGSSDDTPTVAASFGSTVCYIRQANAGVSAARNAGVSAARGEFIAFLDSDDIRTPESIARQREMLERHARAALVTARIIRRAPDGSDSLSEIPPIACNRPEDFAPYLYESNFIATSATMVRAACLTPSMRFRRDLRTCEDYHLWLRFASRYPAVFLDTALAVYSTGSPLSLAGGPTALMRDELKARYLARRELRARPDCRSAWHRGMARTLAILRDQSFKDRRFAAAARYAFRSMLHVTRHRSKWEWGRLIEALSRGTIGTFPQLNREH